MFETAQLLTKRLSLNLGNITISPSYLQAIAIVVLIFVLILTLSKFRRHMLDWSMKGAVFGVIIGFVLALVLEGFLIIGGRTALTEVIGWKNAPKPLVNVLDAGRDKLADVLGMQASVIPTSYAEGPETSTEFLKQYQKLSVLEAQKVQSLICKP
jgi:hypothetical protein